MDTKLAHIMADISSLSGANSEFDKLIAKIEMASKKGKRFIIVKEYDCEYLKDHYDSYNRYLEYSKQFTFQNNIDDYVAKAENSKSKIPNQYIKLIEEGFNLFITKEFSFFPFCKDYHKVTISW